MVLGLRTKNRISPSVPVDYVVHIQDVKPWPPSQSLRTLRAVVIQWEHGDRTSGSTNQVVPSLGTGAGVGDGRIEFNESFRLSVTLRRELSLKGGGGDSFQKNLVEFNLYEPRRDKTMKGQLLGTAVVDLADYGVAKEALSISAPINIKRSYRNTSQPLLYLKIQPVEKSHRRSLSRDSLMREPSMDRRSVAESVSSLMNEEYTEEAEIASFTDDDISSHSSQAVSSSAIESNDSSPPQNNQNGLENPKYGNGEAKHAHLLPLKQESANSHKEGNVSQMSLEASSSHSSSVDTSSDLAWITRKIGGYGLLPSSPSVVSKEIENGPNSNKVDKFGVQPLDIEQKSGNGNGRSDIRKPSQPSLGKNEPRDNGDIGNSLGKDFHLDDKFRSSNSVESHANGESHENNLPHSMRGIEEAVRADSSQYDSKDNDDREKNQELEQELEMSEDELDHMEDKPINGILLDPSMKEISLGNDEPTMGEDLSARKHALPVDKPKHLKSVRSPLDSNRGNGLVRNNQFFQNGSKGASPSEKRDAKVYPKDTRNNLTESKMLKLESRLKMLEGELREAAALEVGLYSVVSEHGSSTNKVHAPARRLSRLYLHACKETSQARRGSAAKSAVSGLILVAKACGNDVPRLTFWLSNSIVLRAVVSKSFEEQPHLPVSSEPITTRTSDRNNKKNVSQLKWQPFPVNGSGTSLHRSIGDWEDPSTFTNALQRVESWIFSRIIESIWWQTLTPHMQSGAARAIGRSMGSELSKVYRRASSSGGEQVNFSLELWKKAFKDACERICPVRAAGHECGCLPVLSRLIMAQCVARLDVAMFNAILRESADEIPTDPVSDPISDAEVLPIPTGKASFGAGAQLKNAIGNWSRWLTDLFGIDDDESPEVDGCTDDSGDERTEQDASSKSFHLLNALSDLMMLPKDMLLSRTVRKEVCPVFGAPVIRRVLNSFVPDEFCPDPIPRVVLETLNSEDTFEAEDDSVIGFPCAAAPIYYAPPSASHVPGVYGDTDSHSQLRRSGSSVLNKSYTSDDELDELDSPLSSIIDGHGLKISPSSAKTSWMPREDMSQNAVRYRLLREVWKKNL